MENVNLKQKGKRNWVRSCQKRIWSFLSLPVLATPLWNILWVRFPTLPLQNKNVMCLGAKILHFTYLFESFTLQSVSYLFSYFAKTRWISSGGIFSSGSVPCAHLSLARSCYQLKKLQSSLNLGFWKKFSMIMWIIYKKWEEKVAKAHSNCYFKSFAKQVIKLWRIFFNTVAKSVGENFLV